MKKNVLTDEELKEFDEFKHELDVAEHIGSHLIQRYLLKTIIVLIIVGAVGFGATFMKKKAIKDAEREIFKSTVTYTESAASFLADSYKQYCNAKDDTEKKAIMEYVSMRYPNLDTDCIQNDQLRIFYNKCIGGN